MTARATLLRRALRLLREWQGALGKGDRPDLDALIADLRHAVKGRK